MKNYISFIIAHGNLADELDKVAHNFLPADVPVWTYSNYTMTIENIVKEITIKIDQKKPDNVIVFVDLMGGSCWHAAMNLKKKYENLAIITGINIAALVSFASNIEKLEWNALIDKIEEDGKKAIRTVK